MRFVLDPTSPSGVSVEKPGQVIQSGGNGYVVRDVTGLITAGTNVTLAGNGTQASPYQISATGGGGGGTTDHGALTGLTDDDHPQYLLSAGDTMTGRLNFPATSFDITNPPIRFTDVNVTDDESSKGNIIEWGGNMQSGVSYPYGIATQAYKDNPAATFTVPTSGYKKWGWILTHYDSPSSTGEDVHQHLNLETVKADFLTVITRFQISFGEDVALVSFPNSNVKIFDSKNFQIGTDADGLYIKHDTALARLVFSGNTPWNITGTGGMRIGSVGNPGGMVHAERATDGIMFYAKNTAAGGTATAQHLIEAVTSGSTSIATKVTGESINRFSMNHSGRMEWGSGAATRDTNLYRNAADVLKTDDSLIVGASLTVGTITGLLKGTSGLVSAATAGTDYLAPTGNGSALTGITQSQVANLTSDLALKAPLASPTFTGTVAVPTPTTDTGAVTKAYVDTKARRQFYIFDDFVGNVNSSALIFTGSGSNGTLAAPDASSIGVLTLNTGAGTTNRQGVWSNNVTALYFDTTAVWQYEQRVKLSALSDGTDTYQFFAGFGDVATGESVDGAYFSYTHGTNSGKFEVVTSSNSVRTRTDSTITVVADTWYVLKIIVLSVAGTLTARFYINDVQRGGDITTNIPNTTARTTGYGTHIVKSAGTTNRFASVDYIEVSGLFGAGR